MSQLNDDNENLNNNDVIVEDKKENTKFTKNKIPMKKEKKIVILTIVVSLICIILTVLAIFFKTRINPKTDNNNTTIENGETKNSESELATKSLTERYLPNNLTTQTFEYIDGKTNTVDLYNYNYNVSVYKVKITYDQISGLKDKTIETKINNEIKDKAFEIYNSKKNEESYKNVSRININASICGDFSNVLSVKLSYDLSYIKYDKDPNEVFDALGLNYRLDTGEKIKFTDLFINSANLNDIIADSKYIDIAWESLVNTMEDIDMSKIDTSKYEEEILAYVNEFSKEKNPEFYFSQSKIYVKVGNENEFLPIDMSKYYNNIAIFKRYNVNANLFENSNENKIKPFVFNLGGNGAYIYDDIYSNLFVDVTLLGDNRDKFAKVNEKVKLKINDLIETQKSKSLLNKNSGTAYRVFAYTSYNNGDNFVDVYYEAYENTMAIDYYKNNIYSLIAEYERKPKSSVGGNYFEDYEGYKGNSQLINNSKVTIKDEYKNERYNLDGNLVTDKKNNNTNNSNNNTNNNTNNQNQVNIYTNN